MKNGSGPKGLLGRGTKETVLLGDKSEVLKCDPVGGDGQEEDICLCC